jgi:hypothetical protein
MKINNIVATRRRKGDVNADIFIIDRSININKKKLRNIVRLFFGTF